MELDEKQRQIIRELQKDAKKSLRDLSETLDIPVSTVYSRIQKMEKEKLIDGYKTVFNAENIGLTATAFIMARLRWRDLDSKDSYAFREIADKIAEFDEVQEVHLVTGDWDLVIKVKMENSKVAGRFVVDKLSSIEGIVRTMTYMVFDTQKETTDLPI